MIIGKFRVYLFVIMTALGLTGCATPVVENYTKFQDKSYSPRTQLPALFEGDITELMQNGYLLIGYLDFKHNIQKCHKGRGCIEISQNEMTLDELQQRTAKRGADRIQVLYSSLELTPDTYSVCNYYTTTTYTDKDGNTRTMTVCASYSSYSGYMESWNKRALLWRYDPELATADNNYKAVQQAYAILNKGDKKAEKKNPGNEALNIDLSPIESQELNNDIYGVQLITAIENDNLQFLASQLNTTKLTQWQQLYRLDLLLLALEMQKASVYNWLIDQDIAWETEDADGYTALEYAIAFAEPETVDALLGKSLDHRKRFTPNDKSYKAFAMSESAAMVDYLRDKGFSLNGKVGGLSLLEMAIAYNNSNLAKELLRRGVRVSSYDAEGVTPLNTAIARHNTELVELLIKHGAAVDKADSHGNTPLHYAARYGTQDVTQQLIKHGANLNAFNKEKFSPLYTALLEDQWDIAELLMQQKLKYTIPNKDAFLDTIRVLLHRAPASTLDLFLKNTKILLIKDLSKLNTSMLVACAEHCSEQKMGIFFDNGVNLNYSPEGKSLFRTAYDKKNIGVLKAMVKRGYDHANPNDNLPINLDSAVVAGNEVLVEVYRMAQVEQQTSDQQKTGK